MNHHDVTTWIRLQERLSRQSASKKGNRIVLKNEDGTFSYLILKYNETGSFWWFDKRTDIK